MEGFGNLRNFVAERPSFDFIFPTIVFALAWFLGASSLIPSEEARLVVYGAVATISGLVLAAATFVAALTYQSSNILMERVRSKFSAELARNWRAIIASSLVSSVLAILLVFFDASNERFAVAGALGLLALVLARGIRAVWWLMYTLFMDNASTMVKSPIPAPTVESVYGRSSPSR